MLKKAILIMKENLDMISESTKIRKESLETIASTRDCYLVVDPELHFGWQTYHESIFRDQYTFVRAESTTQFNEVTSK